MALEDENKVPSIYNSSCDNYYECDDDNDDDDESFILSKLMHNYTSLLSRKNFYKYKFTSLTKKFEDLKIEFSNLVQSNNKIVSDLKKIKFLGRTTQESKWWKS